MDTVLKVISLVKGNLQDITDFIAYAVMIASVIIKLTPTLKDDNYFKPIVKFIGKYIALDKYGPKG